MYLDFFRLSQKPFSIAPDPAFLYLSEKHGEALAHLMYGLTSEGGFVLVTGEVGTGKTTLLRNLIEQVPADQDVAFILNPRLTVRELLESLCDELGVKYDKVGTNSVKQYIDHLNRHLLSTHALGRSTVMIIDEAQNLSPAVLEQIRLLTNLETNERKLLRIILLGQPELSEMLARQDLRQLAQRITARYHLEALTREDTFKYVAHRMTVSGGSAHVFTPGALRRIYRLSKGIPRLINVICDRSLLGAYVEGAQKVTPAIVSRAAAEVQPARNGQSWWIAAAAAVMVALAATAFVMTRDDTSSGRLNTSAAPPASPAAFATPIGEPAVGPGSATSRRAAANPIESPVVDLYALDRPAGARAYPSQRAAFNTLFATWGVGFQTRLAPCEYAETVGLRCLRRQGTLQELEALNRPAILELWDDGSDPYFAALTAKLADGRYRVILEGETFDVADAAIDAHWFGTHTVLWRPPPSFVKSLTLKSRGPAVGWLRERLAVLDPNEVDVTAPNLFDEGMRARIAGFQRRMGLRPDGIAGPITLMHLDTQTDPSIAVLAN